MLLDYHRLCFVKNNTLTVLSSINYCRCLCPEYLDLFPETEFIFLQLLKLHLMHLNHIILSFKQFFNFFNSRIYFLGLEGVSLLKFAVFSIYFLIFILKFLYSILHTINMQLQLLLYANMLAYLGFKFLNHFFIDFWWTVTTSTGSYSILLRI
jgi:hypothetical protein